MSQWTEAVEKKDDWTGVGSAKTRRKIPNWLNVRAHRQCHVSSLITDHHSDTPQGRCLSIGKR
ncbi:hypothetical protein BJX76DRAFT_342263 [Aspergillus varians]